MYRVFFAILLTASFAFAAVDVAFMVSEPKADWDGVMDFFKDDWRFGDVDYYDCTELTPPTGVFVLYDVIVVGGVAEYLDAMLFGDHLADYMDQGGRVVVEAGKLAHRSYGGIGGAWFDGGYAPYYSIKRYPITGLEDLVIDDADHYIFTDVVRLWDCNWRIDTTMREGAIEIAHFPDAGGVALNAAETVAGINFLVTDSWIGDGYLIFANAAAYVSGQAAVEELSWGSIKAEFK